jgi:hypothetical protein
MTKLYHYNKKKKKEKEPLYLELPELKAETVIAIINKTILQQRI